MFDLFTNEQLDPKAAAAEARLPVEPDPFTPQPTPTHCDACGDALSPTGCWASNCRKSTDDPSDETMREAIDLLKAKAKPTHGVTPHAQPKPKPLPTCAVCGHQGDDVGRPKDATIKVCSACLAERQGVRDRAAAKAHEAATAAAKASAVEVDRCPSCAFPLPLNGSGCRLCMAEVEHDEIQEELREETAMATVGNGKQITQASVMVPHVQGIRQCMNVTTTHPERQHLCCALPNRHGQDHHGLVDRERFTWPNESRKLSPILVSCCGPKQTEAGPAQWVYKSPLFHLALAYAKWLAYQVGEEERPVLIVSGLHGLVDPQQIIQPYDFDLTTATPRQKRRFAELVAAQWQERFPGVTEATSLCGARYNLLLPVRIEIEEPLQGLGIGDRKRWLKQATPIHEQPGLCGECNEQAPYTFTVGGWTGSLCETHQPKPPTCGHPQRFSHYRAKPDGCSVCACAEALKGKFEDPDPKPKAKPPTDREIVEARHAKWAAANPRPRPAITPDHEALWAPLMPDPEPEEPKSQHLGHRSADAHGLYIGETCPRCVRPKDPTWCVSCDCHETRDTGPLFDDQPEELDTPQDDLEHEPEYTEPTYETDDEHGQAHDDHDQARTVADLFDGIDDTSTDDDWN